MAYKQGDWGMVSGYKDASLSEEMKVTSTTLHYTEYGSGGIMSL